MDIQFFKPFVDSTLKVLSVQCKVDAIPQKPFIKGTQPQPVFEIAAVIGITSAAFTGSVTLCFPEKAFLVLMSNMLGEQQTEINCYLQDGAAELLNMIFGATKVILNERGYQFQSAIPSVILGEKLKTAHMTQKKVFVLPFEFPDNEFHIEISAEEARGS